MKQTKRILSVLICLAMVLSLLSVVTFAATPDILYFQPNSDWTQAGARFALWTWSGSGSGSWTTCIDSDGDGIYEADIPDGHNMVIFARMSPNGSIDWGSKWNQSGDISIPTDGKNLYIQKKGDWDCKGTWDYFEIPECYHENHDQTGLCPDCGETIGHSFVEHVCICGLVEPMIAEPGYYLVGKFGGTEFWFVNETSADRMFSATEDENVLEIVYTFTVGDEYKIVSYDGYGNITWPDGDNLVVNEAGELTMRFEPATGKSYFYHGCDHLEHDADGNCTNCGEAVGHDFADGTCGICGAADPDYVSITVYCINSSNWAEVTAYAWTDGGVGMSWPGEPMTKTENTVNGFDVYELTLHTAYENIIFNNNNNGYQTGDQILMAGQYFDVKDAIWYASLEDVPEVEDPGVTEPVAPSYYVAGDMNGWNSCDAAYIMNAEADGIYTLTFAVTAGDYGLKVTDGTWNNSWGKDGGNYNIKAYTDGEVTVTFNTADFSVNVTGECLTNPTPDCAHTSHDADGICAECGEFVGHDFADGTCGICGAADPDYVPPCDHVEHDMDGNCTNCGEYVGHSFDENYACACGKTIETVTVYFQNNWLWREVSIFFWGSELADPIWPGYSMEFYNNDGLYDVYSYNIPVDVDGVIINGKKDDGSNTLDQTPDIKEGFYDGICYYMTWDDGNTVGSLNVELLFCEHENHDQEGNCTNCGTAVEHVYEAVVTNPDCVNPGYTTYTCACGSEYTDNETDPVHGDIIHVEAVAADCYENGNIEHWYCEICGQAWLDAECTLNTNLKAVILPKGHSDIIHVEAVAATCYTDGNIEYWYCDTCGQAWLDADCTRNTNLKSVILPMGHGEITHMEAIAANCYLDGNIEYWFCEACGQAWLDADCIRNTNLMSVILPSQGHSFADGFCGNCGEADPDYVPPVEKPIKVENLTMVSNTRSSITVSWDAFDGAENYWLFLDGAAYNCTAGTTMTITGRQVATAYEIYVLAVMDDGSMLKAADADVLTAETKDYELSGYAYSEGRDIHVEWEADGCNRAWMLYGTNADDLIVYDESNDGTFTKANLKAGTTYYVQIAYLIDNKVIYGEIMEVYVFSNTEFIPL